MAQEAIMDYETIGEIKYFLSDKELILKNGYDKESELKILEKLISRSKNSFMIAANQLHLLNDIGFVRTDGYNPLPNTQSFLQDYKIKNETAEFSYVRTYKNKTIELFFSDFELISEGEAFYYVSMKAIQDKQGNMGNSKQPFLYVYSEIYNAEPLTYFKNIDQFIEKTSISNHYNSYAEVCKEYYPNAECHMDVYLSEVAFNNRKGVSIMNYSVCGKNVSMNTIKRLLPNFQWDVDSLATRKTILDERTAELIKILLY